MTLRHAAVLAVLCCASSALAQRVTIAPFTGPGASGVRNQLVSAACDSADCVASGKTTTRNKPDWKKAKKERVQFFVTGAVVKKGKNQNLDLQVFSKAGAPKARKAFALEKNGTLGPKNLQAALDLLDATFGKAESPPAPAPTPPVATSKPPPPGPTTPPAPTATTTKPKEPSPRAEPSPREDPTDVRDEAPPPPTKRGSAPFLVIDVGADVLNRRLAYSQVATANLRSYDLALFAQPALGLQFYPLALMRDDLLAGLGVELAVALAPWLQSRLASSPEAFPTSTLRFDGGLRFRIVPVKSFPFSISPYLGVRTQSFAVGALSDGRRLDGLPNIAFVGLRVGVGVEVPIIIDRLFLFGRFGVVPVFSSGEILTNAFFPNGSAFGLEANGGVGVGLTSFLQVRASFEFASYGLSFSTQATDPYVAAGATDRYLGGNASLRFTF